MALKKSQKIAVLERWLRVLYANYLRYAKEHALAWMDRSSFESRELVDRCVAEQQALFDQMAAALIERGGVLPPLGWPEDVAYLNYVHLPVIFRRSIDRMSATLEPFRSDIALLEQQSEFDLVDLAEAYVALVERQCAAMQPHCGEASELSPR